MVILYIDDDPDDAEVFCEIVNDIDASVECIIAAGYKETVKSLRAPCPHLVFIDFRMPVIDGKEILQLMRENQCFHQMKIIMYSTAMSDRDIEECRRLGAHDCLNKTGNVIELRERIKKFIKNHPS